MYNSGIGTPYWFEWEIGILECLNMLQDTSIESVILQSTDFQALDDVVVNYSDKSILNIQVKHTDEVLHQKKISGKHSLLNGIIQIHCMHIFIRLQKKRILKKNHLTNC